MTYHFRHQFGVLAAIGLSIAAGCATDTTEGNSSTAIDLDVGDDVSSDNNPYEELCDALLRPAELEQVCSGSEAGSLAVGWERQSTNEVYHDCDRRLIFRTTDDVYWFDIDLDDNETLAKIHQYRVIGHDPGLEGIADGASYDVDKSWNKRVIKFTKGQFTGSIILSEIEGGCTFEEHVEIARSVVSKIPETWPAAN
jgi:hypothetical protein